ncbi:hypothetical protein [Nocardioides sp. GXZ039]|uniref:hypothetical protein n=1 Tax=Nocardioides sp. GXZ039 TaxID=3136018 RepID=UPI0030F49F6E
MTAPRRCGAALVLLALLVLTACGGPEGADAPTDADVVDFCRVIGSIETSAPDTFAHDLFETGTPPGIPGDARAGFEVLVDEADADEISDADQAKVEAFFGYFTTTFTGVPAGDQ